MAVFFTPEYKPDAERLMIIPKSTLRAMVAPPNAIPAIMPKTRDRIKAHLLSIPIVLKPDTKARIIGDSIATVATELCVIN